MDGSGRLGPLLKFKDSGDVIDMGVSADDLFQAETMIFQYGEDMFGITTRIDHDGFAAGLIAKNRTVALQVSDRKCFTDHRGLSFYDGSVDDFQRSIDSAGAFLKIGAA